MSDEFVNSEYNNAGELYGLDAVAKMIAKAPSTAHQAQIIKKATAPGQVPASRRSRGEMEKFFKQLPDHIKEALKKGEVRLSDYTISSIKPVTSKTIKMFEPQDNKETGVRNISAAKLPKNSVFVVSGIIILVGINPAPTNDEGRKAIDFVSISTIPALANGEFSLKANRKNIIPEGHQMRHFVTDHNSSVNLGYYKLDNPRLIRDEEVIEFTIDLGTQLNIPANAWVYVGLDGTGTAP